MKFRLLVVAMVLLAGCANTQVSDGSETSIETTTLAQKSSEAESTTPTPKGSVRAEVVDSPPSNATVVALDNESLQAEEYQHVREVVNRAIRDDSGFAQTYVYGDDVDATVGVMSKFPYHESEGYAGIFVAKNGTVVEVLAYREEG